MLEKLTWVARPDYAGEWYKKLPGGEIIKVKVSMLGEELIEEGKEGRLWAIKDGNYLPVNK